MKSNDNFINFCAGRCEVCGKVYNINSHYEWEPGYHRFLVDCDTDSIAKYRKEESEKIKKLIDKVDLTDFFKTVK